MKKNLSSYSHMIGNIFPRINHESDVEKYMLTQSQVEIFRRTGSLSNIEVMDSSALDTLRNDLSNIITGKIDTSSATDLNHEPFKGYDGIESSDNLIYLQGAWLLTEAFHDIIYNPKITIPISQLLNIDKVRFLHDQVFYKPPHHGSNISWHQDYSYWQRTGPENHISVWIPLDDASLDNGTLQYIPGSQHWPLLSTVELAGGDMNALDQYLTHEQMESFKPVPVEMRAGCVEFHGSRVVHGSMPNNSDIPRRALVLNYMDANTLSQDGDRPIMPGFPIIPKGEVISGPGFPIVYDRLNPTSFFK